LLILGGSISGLSRSMYRQPAHGLSERAGAKGHGTEVCVIFPFACPTPFGRKPNGGAGRGGQCATTWERQEEGAFKGLKDNKEELSLLFFITCM